MIPSPESPQTPSLREVPYQCYHIIECVPLAEQKNEQLIFYDPEKKNQARKKGKKTKKGKIHGPKTSQIINSIEANSQVKGKKNIPNL